MGTEGRDWKRRHGKRRRMKGKGRVSREEWEGKGRD